jgi:hypothetical protein
MNLDQYLSEIVYPTIADFEANPTSRRRAFLACVTTFHAIDYIADSGQKTGKRNLRGQFRKTSPEFALVDRVAHAFKHVRTGYPNMPKNLPFTSAEVISRLPAFWNHMVWDLSRWNDTQGGVTLTRERNIDLLSVLKKAVELIHQYSSNLQRIS